MPSGDTQNLLLYVKLFSYQKYPTSGGWVSIQGVSSAALLEGVKEKVLTSLCSLLCGEKLEVDMKKQHFLSSSTAVELMML